MIVSLIGKLRQLRRSLKRDVKSPSHCEIIFFTFSKITQKYFMRDVIYPVFILCMYVMLDEDSCRILTFNLFQSLDIETHTLQK